MESNKSYQQFGELLTAEQLSLLRYLVVILGDADAASNVLQEANVVLLQKWTDYEPNTNFTAWARRVAYLQALALVRDKRREKLVFSEDTVRQIAARVDPHAEVSEERMALRHCLSHLSKHSLEAIQQRYRDGYTIAELSERCGKSVSAMKVALHRTRRSLMVCIEKQIAQHN